MKYAGNGRWQRVRSFTKHVRPTGLIAPRPIFVEWGTEDISRPVHPAFEMAQQIYRAAGAVDGIVLHEFNGGHIFTGARSLPWLVGNL